MSLNPGLPSRIAKLRFGSFWRFGVSASGGGNWEAFHLESVFMVYHRVCILKMPFPPVFWRDFEILRQLQTLFYSVTHCLFHHTGFSLGGQIGFVIFQNTIGIYDQTEQCAQRIEKSYFTPHNPPPPG